LKSDWGIDPEFINPSKKAIGLVNLGATCYMNSLFQQLYMIPEFRKGILELDTTLNESENYTRIILHEFQV